MTTPSDVQERTKTDKYATAIATNFDTQAQLTSVPEPPDSDALTVISGKVRDRWETPNSSKVALVTTDRQSGFDRQLAVVPFKGAVLNLTSAYWFDQTKDIIPNHVISIPHPNVTLAHKCTPFPIEFVCRRYLTGSTDTSIWNHYSHKGVRHYCGHDLPDGMRKNQQLEHTILTPTTKEADHDRPISKEDIIQEGWMSREDFEVCETAALAVFARGQTLAAQRGMILVDTKYEFGKHVETGQILLIDEVHTPDSSRWWLADTYDAQFAAGDEPDNISKEFLRLWYRDHCDPYDSSTEVPEAPRALVLELARRYICLYEIITGLEFEFEQQGASADNNNDIGAILKRELE